MSGLVSQTKTQSIRNYFCNASVLIILFSASGCDPGIEPFLTYFVCAIKIHTVKSVCCKVLDTDNMWH